MYKVNDIFYSLQGEGGNTGRAAIFIRFAGCNMRCPFCDTDFSDYKEMSSDDIIKAISAYPARFVVLTGGEPALQVDEALTEGLHRHGYVVAMESNGSIQPPVGIDWLTVSPKGKVAVKRCNELKIVYAADSDVNTHGIEADHYYLQPCDTGDKGRNAIVISECIKYIKEHPEWRLSLQTHKLAGFK